MSRLAIYLLNAIFLVSFSGTLVIINPALAVDFVGYTTFFLVLALIGFPLHWLLRKRSRGARAIFVGFLVGATYVALALLGGTGWGVLAAAHMMLIVSCIRDRPKAVTHERKGEWVFVPAEEAARNVH